MKKTGKKLLCIALAAFMAFGFGACKKNKNALSAYQVAVKNGFVGTEAEWLASLHGINGNDGQDLDIEKIYQSACEAGYQGTLLDFISEYLDVDLRENNDTQTIAENISSTVSIYCAYRTTKTHKVTNGLIQSEYKETTVSASAGSGVIIKLDKAKGDALIVTNYHVLHSTGTDTENDISDCIYVYLYGAYNGFTAGAENTSRRLADINGDGVADKNDQGDHDGDGIKATFIGGAMEYDIAVLRVSGSEYLKNSIATAAVIGDSNNLSIGEKVYAIGNPNGEGIAVTGGLLSVESETITMTAFDDSGAAVDFRVMRTDAAINHGNSGGGLFNGNGQLIGITNAKNVEESTDNMGYALPISQVEKIVNNILDNGGVVKRGMLGITTMLTGSSAAMDASGKLVITEEVTVYQVNRGVAATGKIQVGDIMKSVKIGDVTTQIRRGYMLVDALLDVRKNDKIYLTLERNGKEMIVEIVFDNDKYFTIYD